MMGRKSSYQSKLFYQRINLEKRIRKDHVLRMIDQNIDFDFVYKEVEHLYGSKGNVSVPPPVILKMMLLLIFYNVRSERELMDTIPERLDWLWFLGYDLDDEIPNHSVLSKARSRWGIAAFQRFFDNVVLQCVEAGLVDGSKVLMDSSNVLADASNNSVVNSEDLKRYLKKSYRLFEERLDKEDAKHDDDDDLSKTGIANKKHFSTTDPDASVHRQGDGRSRLKYKIHRGVDETNEVITATAVTSGSVNEAHLLKKLLLDHEAITGIHPDTCIADSKYGTIANYLICNDLEVESHFESFEKAHRGSGRQKGIFPKEDFIYNPDTDTFTCPTGNELKRRRFSKQRRQWEYTASIKTCRACSLMSQCTRSKTGGRSLKRHERQDDLDEMLLQSESKESKRNLRLRQHLMERSFAQSIRYGFKRSRWRRLWRVKIQELLTSTIHNILTYIRKTKGKRKAGAARNSAGYGGYFGSYNVIYRQLKRFVTAELQWFNNYQNCKNNISMALIRNVSF